jgi:hypothetical protein
VRARWRPLAWLLALVVPAVAVTALLAGGVTEGDHGSAQASAPPGGSAHSAASDDHVDSGAADHGAATQPPHDMRSVFPKVDEIYDSTTASGLKIEFTVKSEDEFFGPKNVASGGLATVKLRITDESSGAVRADLLPRAWIDAVSDPLPTTDDRCAARAAGFARGGLADRPLIDLNSFFVLALNQDPTITVIDPLVNFGGMTQLYAMLELPSPGADWDLSDDEQLLVVTSPAAGALSRASTAGFEVTGTARLGGLPTQRSAGCQSSTRLRSRSLPTCRPGAATMSSRCRPKAAVPS